MSLDLASLGWNPFFDSHRHVVRDDQLPGRVAADHGQELSLLTEGGALTATVAGKLRHQARSASDLPAVGDWVALRTVDGRQAVVEAVLPRASALVRQAAGRKTQPQVVAANVDVVAIVTALAADFSARRLERYLSVVSSSGASPLVVLSKLDLCEDSERAKAEAAASAPGVPIAAVSAVTGDGLRELRGRVRAGLTLALVGSSGVGKSTLVNALLGADAQRTGEVRAHDGRGRHVTTHRELFVLPGGGLLIDTPGMRELATWAEGTDVDAAFDDVVQLARGCRFRDCGHGREPGCAVRAAIDEGRLEAARLESHRKLEREAAYQAGKEDARLRQAEQARWKAVTRRMRGFTKEGR